VTGKVWFLEILERVDHIDKGRYLATMDTKTYNTTMCKEPTKNMLTLQTTD